MTNDTCPAGHPATDRPTDGMPIPCSIPTCTYYRRPVATPKDSGSSKSAAPIIKE